MPVFGKIGHVIASTEARIVDDEGKDVTPGTAGELLLKGPQVMKGYYRNAEATDE